MSITAPQPTYSDCIIVNSGKFCLTDMEGHLVKGPGWTSLPLLVGLNFFRYRDAYYSLDGVCTNVLSGEQLYFVNTWLCQVIDGTTFIGRVNRIDAKYTLDDNIIIDKFGVAGYEDLVVFKEGAWRKFIYSSGCEEIPGYDVANLSRRDIREIMLMGPSPEFLEHLRQYVRFPEELLPEVRSEMEQAKLNANRYFAILKGVLQNRSPAVIAPELGVPTSIVMWFKKCLGSRTGFYTPPKRG